MSLIKHSSPERNTQGHRVRETRRWSLHLREVPEVNTITDGITALTAELAKAKIEPSTITQVVARTKVNGNTDRLKINQPKAATKRGAK